MGRRFSLTLSQVTEARSMVADGISKAKIAEHFGISRQGLYRNLSRNGG